MTNHLNKTSRTRSASRQFQTGAAEAKLDAAIRTATSQGKEIHPYDRGKVARAAKGAARAAKAAKRAKASAK